MNDLDNIFVRRINEKQEEAFHELFQRFFNYLVVFAIRRVQRRDVAEDIVQEIFMKVWECEKKFNSYIGFKTFLYNAVANRCLDYLKHVIVENRYAEVFLKEKKEWDELDFVEEEMYRELYLAVSELPKQSRAVFELSLKGKKNEEIAQLLNLSIFTVKSYKKNGLQYLRKKLGKAYFYYYLIFF